MTSDRFGNGEREAALAGLLRERHSCRAYLPDAIPRKTIDTILAMAQRTASWCNSQSWQVHVASETATERLRLALTRYVKERQPTPGLDWPRYEGVYLQRRRECGFQLYNATGVARGDAQAAERQRMENFRFFGAPHVALVTTDAALGTYGAVDCGAYVHNFMLAAHACGVASIAQAALAAYPDFWREQFALPENRIVVCGISFGSENTAHPANSFRTSRASVEDATRWISE